MTDKAHVKTPVRRITDRHMARILHKMEVEECLPEDVDLVRDGLRYLKNDLLDAEKAGWLNVPFGEPWAGFTDASAERRAL